MRAAAGRSAGARAHGRLRCRHDPATVAVRGPARAALPGRRQPAGAARGVPARLRPPPVPPAEGPPGALGDAPPRCRAGRPLHLRPVRHLPRGPGRRRRAARRRPADQLGGTAPGQRPVRGARHRPAARSRLRDQPGRLHHLGGRPRAATAADGGLLPRLAPAARPADGGAGARGGPLELRRGQPRAAAARPGHPRCARAPLAGRGRGRRRGPGGPGPLGGRGGGHGRRGRATPVRRHPRRGAGRPGRLRRAPAPRLRPPRGRRHGRRPLDGALAAVGADEPGAARPGRGRPGRRGRLPPRVRTAGLGGGVHPPGRRLARLRVAPLLAPRAGLPRAQRARRARRHTGVVRGAGPHRDARRVRVQRPDLGARDRLDPPHPAADGARELRAAARLGPGSPSRTGSTAASSTATTGSWCPTWSACPSTPTEA